MTAFLVWVAQVLLDFDDPQMDIGEGWGGFDKDKLSDYLRITSLKDYISQN